MVGKVLVIGGTGAIGKSLVHILLEKKYKVDVTSRNMHNEGKQKNVRFFKGNGHEINFIQDILRDNYYDAIVDFMTYVPETFQRNIQLLLKGTDQYFFMSSGRVYADSEELLTEKSVRLLDSEINREDFITEKYALSKAEEEDILYKSGKKNWTIVRPYLTYNDYRLQLGFYEKECWLPRALAGLSIVLPSDIAKSYTTMTNGEDVAEVISLLIGNKKALGEVIQIASSEALMWGDIAEIYSDVLEKEMGVKLKINRLVEAEEMIGLWPKSLIKYDRVYNRRFCCDKLYSIIGAEKIIFRNVRKGLGNCLKTFLSNPDVGSLYVNYEAWSDRVTKERSSLNRFESSKAKIRYIGKRYFIK